MGTRKKTTRRQKSVGHKKSSGSESRRVDARSTAAERVKPEPGSNGGRPAVVIDRKALVKLIQRGNTIEGCADIFECSRATLNRKIAEDDELKALVAKARAQRNDNLYTYMQRSAKSGSAQVQVWLSKQWLGMRDVRAVELTGADGGVLEVSADLGPVLEEKLTEFIRSRGGDDG